MGFTGTAKERSHNREEGKDQESIQSNTSPDGNVTKTQANKTNKRAMVSALSQQVNKAGSKPRSG